MKLFKFVLIIILLTSLNSFAQLEMGADNDEKSIVRDLTRIWATYYGGTGGDEGRSICTDNSGNVFVIGNVGSTNFPTQELTGAYYQPNNAGGGDIFILKFNSNGERLWATYYGGTQNDDGRSICADNSGNIYITGITLSTDFPVHSLAGAYNQSTHGGGGYDAFILKFTNDGERLWATYYGGSGVDKGYQICSDNAENVYVSGMTASSNFPIQSLQGAYNQSTHAGGGDTFILKFDSNCANTWSTYYGGSSYELGYGICTDISDNLYATGYSGSTDFPVQSLTGAYNQSTMAGAFDAYISKFNSSGAQTWSTYYGGSDQDYSYVICVDNSQNIFVSGSTRSTDYPTQEVTGGYYQSTFAGGWDISLVKFNSDCARLWATYYGGDGSEDGNNICTDNLGYLYVTGNTFSNDFPTQYYDGAYYQPNLAAVWDYDAFVLMFNSSCESIWATYYGGTDPDDGYGIWRDDSYNLYVTGRTESEDFPVLSLSGAYNQTSIGGTGVYDDAFILKVGSMPTGSGEFTNNSASGNVLYQNYPNPFNSTTTIEFHISETSFIKLDIYNAMGQNVSSLINEELESGNHAVEFNATGFPEGIYYFTLKDGKLTSSKKLIIKK